MGVDRQKNEEEDIEHLVYEIASRVAAETNTEPNELTPPIGSVIDGDALIRLVESATGPLQVTFSYQNQEIVVEAGHDVTIRTSQPAD